MRAASLATPSRRLAGGVGDRVSGARCGLDPRVSARRSQPAEGTEPDLRTSSLTSGAGRDTARAGARSRGRADARERRSRDGLVAHRPRARIEWGPSPFSAPPVVVVDASGLVRIVVSRQAARWRRFMSAPPACGFTSGRRQALSSQLKESGLDLRRPESTHSLSSSV